MSDDPEKICKKCAKCEKLIPDTTEYFTTRKRAKGESVTVSTCKKCLSKYAKEKRDIKSENEDTKNKACKICGLSFPKTGYYFYSVTIQGKTYLRPYCKECTKDENIKNYDAHRGQRLDQKKEYRKRVLKGLQKAKDSLQ